MAKLFISYDEIRNNALKLAYKIQSDGFVPDVMYVSLRGGSSMANIMSEYFKIVRRHERPVFFAAVVARSYSGIHSHEEVRVDGWTYNPDFLRNGDKILLIDDIYDSGRTINHLAEIILSRGIPREDLKIAVHDYKVINYDKEKQYPIKPDYWCRQHIINSPEDEQWIHYLSHELLGLSKEERETHYYAKDPELKKILDVLDEA